MKFIETDFGLVKWDNVMQIQHAGKDIGDCVFHMTDGKLVVYREMPEHFEDAEKVSHRWTHVYTQMFLANLCLAIENSNNGILPQEALFQHVLESMRTQLKKTEPKDEAVIDYTMDSKDGN